MFKDDGWGFYYTRTALKNNETKIIFRMDYIYAIYTIKFLPRGEASYSAEKRMIEFDAGSYTPLTKITLTLKTLDEKLASMETGKSTEKDFMQFMESKKFN